VPITDDARNCLSAADTFFEDNDFCVPYFRAFFNHPLGVNVSFDTAAEGVCTNKRCKDRLEDFAFYLINCEALRDTEVSAVV